MTAGAALLGAIGLTAPLCVRVRGRWSDVVDELLRLAAAPVRASDDGLLCDHRFHIAVREYAPTGAHSLQADRITHSSATLRSAVPQWSQWGAPLLPHRTRESTPSRRTFSERLQVSFAVEPLAEAMHTDSPCLSAAPSEHRYARTDRSLRSALLTE